MKNPAKTLRVLHITAWYPAPRHEFEAVWIHNHTDSLSPFCTNHVLHLEVAPGQSRLEKRMLHNGRQLVIKSPLFSWGIAEWLNACLLIYYIVRLKINHRYDIVNFHIAYPQLVKWHLLRHLVKIPTVVTEHWSAYHFNFNIAGSRALERIKRIFTFRLNMITVSSALASDIRKFSGVPDLRIHVVPNTVDTEVFYLRTSRPPVERSFFMLSGWKYPKDPFTVLNALKIVNDNGKDIRVRIGGYGNLWQKMQDEAEALGITGSVDFLGPLTPKNAALEMNAAAAFLHCSDYETFSVVCAEALCCGVPVIASAVGGITEFVNADNGALVPSNAIQSWVSALNDFDALTFNREAISDEAARRFSSAAVGAKYYNVLLHESNRTVPSYS